VTQPEPQPSAVRHQGGSWSEAHAAVEQMANGYWTTQIVYTMAKLTIPDLLAEGPQGVDELARATETNASSLYRLMRALASLGLVRERPDGLFETTDLGRCLATGAPGNLRARAILNGDGWYPAWGDLLDSVRTGEAAFDRVTGRPLFEHLACNPRTAAVFNETMAGSTESAARAVASAYDFSQSATIVDVGGGTGAFLAGLLEASPHMRGILVDLPNVIPDAEGLLASAGVTDRCEVVAGDFFEAVPAGGDTYILSWVIHDWDDQQSITILKNCRQAMADNTRLLVIEQVIPPGNDPSLSKLYDLHMLVLTGGRERTENEYRALLAAADFELTRVIHTDAPRSVIEALPR
jgi:O-methyltransferase domain/Dimerisation domain